MLRRLSKLISGGKRVKLMGGPGNGMTFILDGKARALEYEVKGITYYYQWDGLTDGTYNLYSFLGKPNQGNTPFNDINQSNIITPNIMESNLISDPSNLIYRGK
jgi:hypothetical protein